MQRAVGGTIEEGSFVELRGRPWLVEEVRGEANEEDLVGERGAEMSSLQVRQMVRDALDDGSFKTAPEVRKSCVRVYYEAGFHVDVPIYRRVTSKDVWGNESHHHELASSDWKRSDARHVTDWFEKENNGKSRMAASFGGLSAKSRNSRAAGTAGRARS